MASSSDRGRNRTKVEIKRDYEYLLRLWDSVRELTLKSNAPALVYEEATSSKRVIRISTTRYRGRWWTRKGYARPRIHAHAHAEPCEECETL